MTFAALILAAMLSGATDAAQTLPAATIEQAVREVLRSRLDEAGSTAAIDVISRLQDQSLPAGTPMIEVGVISGPLPRSRLAVPVRLQVEGRLVRVLTVWVALQDRRQVLTYATAHRVGDEAALMNPVPAIVDMTCCPGTPVAEAREIEGQRLASPVRAGEPVMLEDYEAIPAVVARSEVEVEVVRGGITLNTTGIALGDGGVGEVVVVLPRMSGEAVRSRVTGLHKVRVE